MFIDTIMESVNHDLDETFAFGKTRAERGGARFKTKDSMWTYMTDNKGQHQHSFNGAKGTAQIFCNAAETGDAQEDGGKSRAVRKVIRTLIEANGGNGELVKKKIETNRRGVVWFKDDRVAEWKVENGCAGKMKLMGEMLQLEDAFNTLMDFKKPE